jgi:tetratricopeptide (TPR) repeat protein
MKARKKPIVQPPPQTQQPSYRLHLFGVLAGLILAAFLAYSPALRGPFVFDDFGLPYYNPKFPKEYFVAWIAGVRPLLMITYWLNYQWSGGDTFSYHLLGLIFHLLNAGLVYLIARRILKWDGLDPVRSQIAAIFTSALFLLHPVQTESVAYIASRSENLSGLFFLSALAVFLYRRTPGIGWLRSISVLALFGAAVATKENTVVLPAVLIAADLWEAGEQRFAALRRNWRLYLPLLALTPVAALMIWRVVSLSESAGFHLSGLGGPLTYFWTECAAFLRYIELSVFPFRQTIDYDVPWIQSPLNFGTLLGLAAAIGLAAAAWIYRKRYPAATFGIAMFLLLLSPTSSFIPLKDPIAEHRMYLPLIGIALIAASALVRVVEGRTAMIATAAAVAAIATFASMQRNHVWSSESALWSDAVSKSPDKMRDYSHLVHGLVNERRCKSALSVLDGLQRRGKVDSTLLVHWSFALECVQDFGGAVEKLKEVVKVAPTPDLHLRIARLLARLERVDEAKRSAGLALELDPKFEAAYALRGDLNWYQGDWDNASRDYARVLELNPANQGARRRLDELNAKSRRQPAAQLTGSPQQTAPGSQKWITAHSGAVTSAVPR